MHALLIHQAFASPKDAGGTRHFELGRRLVTEGHRFTVVTSRLSYLTGRGTDAARDEEIEGLRVLRVTPLACLHRSFFWRCASFLSFMILALWPAVRCGPVDVVMGTSPPLFQALTAWLVAVLKRKPFLLEIRDLWPEFAVAMGVLKNRFLIWAARRVEAFLYARASHILVNSPAYRDYLRQRGIPREKISLIPNGVDPAPFAVRPCTDQIRQEFGLRDQCVVTYAGALGAANDLGTLLAAARRVRHPAIHFLLIGDGKERSRLEQLAAAEGLTNVTFAGARSKADMPALLAASDICVAILQDIPAFRTTYPNKVFDYMAAGRPVVLAIDGVIREVIETSGGGVFVQPGDAQALAAAVETLYLESDLRHRMGQAAQEYVTRHFHRDDQAAEFVRLLARLSGRPAEEVPMRQRRAA